MKRSIAVPATVLDRSGEAVFSFTTEVMYGGFANGAANPVILIYR